MELNNGTLLCEPCQIGFYKNVSANDSMFDINERFWCLSCPDGLTTYDFGTIHNYECIGMNILINENKTKLKKKPLKFDNNAEFVIDFDFVDEQI